MANNNSVGTRRINDLKIQLLFKLNTIIIFNPKTIGYLKNKKLDELLLEANSNSF